MRECINFGAKKYIVFKTEKLIYILNLMYFFIILFISLISKPVLAYIGPGLGLGLVASIIGLIFSVLLFVVAIIWFPLRKLFKKNKDKNKINQK